MSKWIPCSDSLPSNGITVETKIDDKDGLRNVACLKRVNGLWLFPDDSMYIYYRPTHWRIAQPKPESAGESS